MQQNHMDVVRLIARCVWECRHQRCWVVAPPLHRPVPATPVTVEICSTIDRAQQIGQQSSHRRLQATTTRELTALFDEMVDTMAYEEKAQLLGESCATMWPQLKPRVTVLLGSPDVILPDLDLSLRALGLDDGAKVAFSTRSRSDIRSMSCVRWSPPLWCTLFLGDALVGTSVTVTYLHELRAKALSLYGLRDFVLRLRQINNNNNGVQHFSDTIRPLGATTEPYQLLRLLGLEDGARIAVYPKP
jgi:hypothetical protein